MKARLKLVKRKRSRLFLSHSILKLCLLRYGTVVKICTYNIVKQTKISYFFFNWFCLNLYGDFQQLNLRFSLS